MSIRILFDTTVLCGATLNPFGVDMKLLQMARELAPEARIEPIITQQVVAEWEKNCRLGFKRSGGPPFVVPESVMDRFAELLTPLLSPEMIATVALGRFEAPLYPVRRHSRLDVIQLPIKGMKPQKSQMAGSGTFALTDIFDFHVVDAALLYECAYICTYNQRDLPDGLKIGDKLEVIRPERLHRRLNQ